MIAPSCTARLSVYEGTPVRAYVVWPSGGRPLLCRPCVAELRSMGVQVELEQRREPRRIGLLARLRARAAG